MAKKALATFSEVKVCSPCRKQKLEVMLPQRKKPQAAGRRGAKNEQRRAAKKGGHANTKSRRRGVETGIDLKKSTSPMQGDVNIMVVAMQIVELPGPTSCNA